MEIITALLSGVVSGSCSVGAMIVTIKHVGEKASEAKKIATRAHDRINGHIADHARGVFK